MWASGDFSVVAARIALISEQLADSADIRAGSRVLDVATGSGNAAIAGGRSGASVLGVDYVPALLEHARLRVAGEGLDVEFTDGDAENLPVPDHSFDTVLSVVGTMFAPDHARTAAEMVRVCRPGGTIALASWTPEGFIGEMLRTIAAHVPPPAGVRSPLLWGTEAHLRNCSVTRSGRSGRWSAPARFATPRRRHSSASSAAGTDRRSRRSKP